jgi:choloylglycine hydrolase
MTFPATGHGAGMLGLPGDLTPPSRFTRLAVLTKFSDIQPDGQRTLNLAQHIINTFTIPFGLVTDTLPNKKVLKESTQWVSYRDLTHGIFYFKTYENNNLRKIDLKRLDFSGPAVKRIPMFGSAEIIVDISDRAR